jgi:hypothetical protein
VKSVWTRTGNISFNLPGEEGLEASSKLMTANCAEPTLMGVIAAGGESWRDKGFNMRWTGGEEVRPADTGDPGGLGGDTNPKLLLALAKLAGLTARFEEASPVPLLDGLAAAWITVGLGGRGEGGGLFLAFTPSVTACMR